MGNTNVALLEEQTAHWLVAHRALSLLAKQRAAADSEEGRCLLAALRAATHVHFGFGSFAEYVERLFGYKPRTTQDKLRVAEALETLPATARALEEGELNWSAVRELTRVAVVETEREWLQVAHGKTLRQLEELVAGRAIGDTPASPPEPSLRRHVLRFEVSAETFALFREAMIHLRRTSDEPLDDDTALLTIARHVLAGPRDEGRSSYQVVATMCPDCRNAAILSGGERIPVAPAVAQMACCDAQHVHAQQPANESVHVGAAHGTNDAHVGTRASQDIPPARRRSALLRDHKRCRVPGCKNATFVDLHHIHAREEGGRHDLDNLLTLCGAHHRAVHRGELLIEGTSEQKVLFRHADGRDYGHVLAPSDAKIREKLFAALRGLGFHQAQIQAVLAALQRDAGFVRAPAEQLLRDAIQRLTARAQPQ
jgi:hypothetical protein